VATTRRSKLPRIVLARINSLDQNQFEKRSLSTIFIEVSRITLMGISSLYLSVMWEDCKENFNPTAAKREGVGREIGFNREARNVMRIVLGRINMNHHFVDSLTSPQIA
jgi:hypothetical protein